MIQVLPNAPQYHEFIRGLRNDPRVQDGFLEEVAITPSQQEAYMAKHADAYVVALANGSPAGYAGVIDGDIRVCTHPDYQGQGVGRALIAALRARWPHATARVKRSNTASQALFLSCGFQITDATGDLLEFRQGPSINDSVSVVIPVFGSPKPLHDLTGRLEEALATVSDDLDIILVDDGGPPENWVAITTLAHQRDHVRGIRLSRNFGQQEAIAAGISVARGDRIVVMDCDLQDPPECVPSLLDALDQGADIAIGARAIDPAGPIRSLLNAFYYRVLSLLSGYRIEPGQGTFSAITRHVADAYLSLGDLDRPYRLVLDWLGFSVSRVEFGRLARQDGQSTYTLWRLLRFALSGVVFQSTRLLYASIAIGAVTSILALLLGVAFIASALSGAPPEGWASTIVVLLMLGGIILMAIGVLGVYIGKIFHQTRGRPMFIIRDQISFSQTPAATCSTQATTASSTRSCSLSDRSG